MPAVPVRTLTCALSVVLVWGCGAAAEATVDLGSQASCEGRESINSQAPERPYSQAVKSNGHIFFAGKIGVTQETRALSEGRIEAETRNVMEGFSQLFGEMGVDFADVVEGTVYLTDIEDYAGMNQVYGEYFPTDPPARVTVGVNEVVAGGIVEISFVAICQ